MGVGLGWQEMAPQIPYIDGEAYNDGISRSGNNVSFSFNLKLRVRNANGYWNYGWLVDMQCGNIVSNNRRVKDYIYGYIQYIGGWEFWQSTYNGNFTGTITVGGKDSYITLSAQFHDEVGNWGERRYWNVGIPTATSMDNIKASVSNVTISEGTISGSITSKGSYSTITKWQITCNNQTKTLDGDNMSFTATFDNLDSETTYPYTIQVWSSTGYTKTYSGSFKTKEDTIGYILNAGDPARLIAGWVIRPDGTKQKTRKIRTVAPK